MTAAVETASYFDNGRGSRLFGIQTHAPGESSRATVVVFCHPIGETKYSSYNAIVAFARRLAAVGISSLRFDFAGFGDSEGETRDVTIASCVADVKSAISKIAGDKPGASICLVGTGLGATIARIVAEEEAVVAALVMLAPVVSGTDYRDSLLRSQQMSHIARGLKAPGQSDLLDHLHKDRVLEVKGEMFGSALFEELSSIDLIRDDQHLPGPLLIVSAPGDDACTKLADRYRRQGHPVTSWLTSSDEFWPARPESLTRLSTDLIDRVSKWIGQTSE